MIVESDYVKLEKIKGVVKTTYTVKYMTLPIAKACVKLRKDNFLEPLPYLLDMSSINLRDRRAVMYLSSPEAAEGIQSLAVITDSIALRFCINLFIPLFKYYLPVKAFLAEDEDLAREWARGCL